MECEECGAPVGFREHHPIGLPPSFRYSELVTAWEEYKQSLMEKYPANDGETWEFTCKYHQKIDDLIND